MGIKTITNNVADRLGNPLEWAAVDKGILLCWVVVPLFFGYIAFAHLARHYLPEGELLDHRQTGHLLIFLYVITALSILIGLLGLWLRRRNPDSLTFQHLAVQNYAISMPLLGYQIGSLSAYVIHRWHLREAEIKQLAIIDPLTGIANRRWILDELERELERAEREGSPLSLIMADLDHFKVVNDSYGHQAGDQVLKTVVERICHTLRKIDRPGRYGGEEFIIVLPDTDLDDARKAAERCRHSIAAEPVRVNSDLPVNITASFGVSCSRHGEDTVASLIQRADQALYRAKQAGRNRTLTA